MAKGKKGGHSPKEQAESEFDILLTNESTNQTPKTHWISFGIFGFVANVAIISLFVSSIYDVELKKNFAIVFLTAIIGTALLAYATNMLSLDARNSLFASRIADLKAGKNSDEDVEDTLKSKTYLEAAAYATFSLNVFYLLFGVMLATYTLPSYGANTLVNMIVSAVLPAVTAVGVAKSHALV